MAGNQTDNLLLLDLTTGLSRTPELGGTPDTIQLSTDFELISGANMLVDGDLVVNGTTTTVHSEQVNINDNHLYLNADYTTTVAQTGGIVVNVLPTATSDTVAATGFTAGVPATSNPTVNTTGSGTFSAGDVIQISGANEQANDGIFEVDSHVGTTLTIRGVGTVGTTQDWVQNDFVTDSTVAGTITLVNVNVLRGNSTGDWETATTSTTTGLTYNTITQQGTVDLQSAYEEGNTITTDAGNGNVVVAGTELLNVTATGGIDLDTVFDADVTTFDVQMTGANGFSIDGTAASNVTADAGDLTLSTTTSGSVLVDGVDGVEVNSTGGALQIGNDADTGAINVGTGAAARTITVGNATGATAVNFDSGTGAFSFDSTVDEATALMTLTTTGANGDSVEFFVGDSDPSGTVTGLAGSLFFRDTGTTGELYLNTSTGSGTTWTQLATGAGNNLQQAYEAGNTISVTAAEGIITFSNSTDATNVLEVSRTFAGAGVGIDLNMGAGTTGVGLDIDSASSGNAVDIAATGAGDALFVNNTGTGAALTVQDGGADVLDVSAAGAVAVTPTSGQDATITVAGAGAVDIDAAAGGVTIDGVGGGISLDSDTASNFTTTGADLTISTATSGELDLTSAGLMDVNAGANLDIDVTGTYDMLSTGTFTIAGTGNSTVNATSGNLGLSTLVTGEVLIDGIDGVEINSSGGAIDIGNDADAQAINVGTGAAARTITVGNATGATAVDFDSGTGAFSFDSTVGEATPLMVLTTTGASGDSVDLFVGDNSPDGSVTGQAGSLFMRDTGATGELWINTSTGSGTTWTQVATGGSVTLQNAYEGGNTITTDAGNGDVTINGTEDFVVGGSVDVDFDTTGSISFDADVASNFTVDSDDLTLSTTTSGDVLVSAADELDLTSGGLMDVNAGANLDVDVTGTMDFLSTGAFSIDGTGASNVTADTGDLTLSTTTSGTLDITSADDIQMTFETNNATAMVIDDGTNNFMTFDSTTGELAVEVNEFMDIVGNGAGVTLTAGEAISAGDVVTIEGTSGDAILADADTGTTLDGLAIGVAAYGAADTAPVKVYTVPGSLIPVNFSAAPAASLNGRPVFVSTTPGEGTTTAPTGSGNVVYILGILQGADGADTSPLVLYQPQFIAVRP